MMIFKDRHEAGKKLFEKLGKNFKNSSDSKIVVSLLRGGAIIGQEIADGLKIKHLPLVVTKISSPTNPELAIGALCFTSTYLEEAVIRSLNLNNSEIERQIEVAKIKFNTYVKNFAIKEAPYQTSVKNKTVILTDDGIATGSTIKVAILYLKSLQPRSIILAVPVAPLDFSSPDIDQEVIIHKNHTFGSVSSFYDSFAQVENNEVMKILNQSATR